MNTRVRVSINTALLTGAQLADKVINIGVTILLVRSLPAETFGQYGFLVSYVVLFGVLVGLGFAPLLTREISRDPARSTRLLGAAMAPMALSSTVAVVLIAGSLLLTKGTGTILAAGTLAALELVSSGFTQVVAAVPRARERMLYAVAPQLVRSVLVLAALWVLLPSGLGLVGVMTVVAVAGGTRLALQLILSKVVFGAAPSLDFELPLVRGMLKEALPLAVASVFVIIYYKIDTVMLSYMRGDREVGLYAAASALAFAPFFIAQAFNQATYPTLARLRKESGERLRRAYRASLTYLTIIGLPVACGLALLAPRIILFIYDDRYLEAAAALRILAVALFLMFLNGFMGNALIIMDRQRLMARIVAAGAVINVGLNFLLIPRYGLQGAATATVAAELLSNVASMALLWREHRLDVPFGKLAAPLVCCGVMAGFVVAFSAWPLFGLVAAAGLLYVALLFVSGSVRKEELRAFGASLPWGSSAP